LRLVGYQTHSTPRASMVDHGWFDSTPSPSPFKSNQMSIMSERQKKAILYAYMEMKDLIENPNDHDTSLESTLKELECNFPFVLKDSIELDVVRISTSSWDEEDFYILSDLSEVQIKKVISPMVEKEREADDLLYDNEDYIVALKDTYPNNTITYYANFDTIQF